MTMNVDCSKTINVCIRITNAGNNYVCVVGISGDYGGGLGGSSDHGDYLNA